MLRIIKRDALAEQLEKRVQIAVKKAELIQKFGETLEMANKEILFVQNDCNATYKMCQENMETMNKWSKYFDEVKGLDAGIVNVFKKRISDAVASVNKRMKEIDDLDNETKILLTETSLDIDEMATAINTILDLKSDTPNVRFYETVKEDIEGYKLIARNYQVTTEELSRIEQEYSKRWMNSVCAEKVEALIEEIKKQLLEKRRMWMERNIYSIKTKISCMNMIECNVAQNTLSKLPDYIAKEDLEEIDAVRLMIIEQIKEHKIAGIVELFKELSDDEKKRVWRR
ncbi:MAG: hypothetical protein IJ583_03550 [Firmicutes bacterium]|nr:hypothetical protein [Bacillota bacterium]